MQYEIIVLGATFTAAGIAQKYGENCLIIERRTTAGYEFFGALNFGNDYGSKPVTAEGNVLLEKFAEKNAFCGDRISLYDCSSIFYKLLENRNVLLNTEIISVEKAKDGFLCTVHGVSGYRTFKAKKVIDTRSHNDMCKSKTYNFSVDGKGDIGEISGVVCEKWGFETNYVLRYPVALDTDFTVAHYMVEKYIKKLPEGFRLLYLADEFDYEVKTDYQKEHNGISYVPSKSHKNPILAYDAGVLYEAGGDI